ncbi:MAG: DUF748 domain-containing protein, partial [Bacteroidota bacterium]
KNGANIAAASADPAKFNLIIEIARYVKVLAKNFFQSDYKINRMAIYHGKLEFNDFAISEKFSSGADPITIVADSIEKNHVWVNVSLKTGIKPYGNAIISLRINPRDSSDFDLQYHIWKVPLSMFNPYLITYTSYPVNRGSIELTGNWNVRNGIIGSRNHLVIIDPMAIRRLKNAGTSWLPLRWIMSFVRERGNVIDYEIPVTGSLKDPKFHLHDVLVDVLENIFVKPATASYRWKVKKVEEEIESSLTLTWKMRQINLIHEQEKFVHQIVEFLDRNPGTSISIYPMIYEEKEREYIASYEARKKYYLLAEHKTLRLFDEEDSLDVLGMSVKDSSFVRFLHSMAKDSGLFTIQDKCSLVVNPAVLNVRLNQLQRAREVAFLSPFKEKSVKSRVTVYPDEKTVPFNGFSYYRIVYKGKLPGSLLKAYKKMKELNNEAPRLDYKKERKRNRNVL